LSEKKAVPVHREHVHQLQASSELVGIPNLGRSRPSHGKVGTIDGMDVVSCRTAIYQTACTSSSSMWTQRSTLNQVLRDQKNPVCMDGDVGSAASITTACTRREG
jgi:hypothetical protein